MLLLIPSSTFRFISFFSLSVRSPLELPELEGMGDHDREAAVLNLFAPDISFNQDNRPGYAFDLFEPFHQQVLLTLQLVGYAQAHLCLGRIGPNLLE